MRRLILSSSLLLALATPAMAGSIYKWVDAQGGTHFGTQPPQGVQAERVNPIVSQPSTPPTRNKQAAEDGASEKQQEVETRVKEEIANEQEALESYCLQVRSNLVQLQNNPRVRIEEEGQLRRLSEEERQAKIAEAQKALSENCD